MIKQGISKLVERQDLSQQEMESVFSQIMQGQATDAQIAAFIIALRLKGETIDEITAAARTMRAFAQKIEIKAGTILDTCGTGGSGLHTFNVSTLAALIASSLGITVAKHGNRSVSSKSGSADLLEKLGVNISADPATVQRCVDKTGIGFLFAPTFHKAMKYAVGPRREIGVRTIFNVLGPLTNPAKATNQLLGVFDSKLLEPVAKVLANLGLKHAIVVHSDDGMDEISTSGPTSVWELKDNQIKNYKVTPEDYGIRKVSISELQITDAEESAGIALDILNNKPGAIYDLVIINSAFAVYAADAAENIAQALEMVRGSLSSGLALKKLEELKKYSNEIDT